MFDDHPGDQGGGTGRGPPRRRGCSDTARRPGGDAHRSIASSRGATSDSSGRTGDGSTSTGDGSTSTGATRGPARDASSTCRRSPYDAALRPTATNGRTFTQAASSPAPASGTGRPDTTERAGVSPRAE